MKFVIHLIRYEIQKSLNEKIMKYNISQLINYEILFVRKLRNT